MRTICKCPQYLDRPQTQNFRNVRRFLQTLSLTGFCELAHELQMYQFQMISSKEHSYLLEGFQTLDDNTHVLQRYHSIRHVTMQMRQEEQVC